jgi:hypothetical protein
MTRMPKGPAFTVPMPIAPQPSPIAPQNLDAQALARSIVEAMGGGVSLPPQDGAVPLQKAAQGTSDAAGRALDADGEIAPYHSHRPQ